MLRTVNFVSTQVAWKTLRRELTKEIYALEQCGRQSIWSHIQPLGVVWKFQVKSKNKTKQNKMPDGFRSSTQDGKKQADQYPGLSSWLQHVMAHWEQDPLIVTAHHKQSQRPLAKEQRSIMAWWHFHREISSTSGRKGCQLQTHLSLRS